MFPLLMRMGIVPKETCERCADLSWGSKRADAGSSLGDDDS
jgi:hypothetical protein